MLDGVSIIPALDDQPGIAVVDRRAFEARKPDGLSAFHTRDQVGDIGSVEHLVSRGCTRASLFLKRSSAPSRVGRVAGTVC